MILSIAAMAIAVAEPEAAAPKAPPPVLIVEQASPKTGKSAGPNPFDMVQKIFDRMFPPQPDPDPVRLALARQSTAVLLPDGSYANAMGTMMNGVADGFLNMSAADFGEPGKDKKPASTETFRQKMIKDDPYFDERMAIVRRVANEEILKVTAILEPKMREGLARSLSRRLDAKQLADLNTFLSTDSGKAFGRENFAMWIDPDAMRAIIGAMPEMMTAMPNVMKRIEAETAHLPKPKKAVPPPKSKASPPKSKMPESKEIEPVINSGQ